MKHLFESDCYTELSGRIGRLHAETPARWGRMNASMMVCHCADPLREALGLRPTKDMSGTFSRSIAKWISFYILRKWPEGQLPTSPEYDQSKQGTSPTDFEKDKAQLLKLMENVYLQPAWYRYHPHPYFGKLTRKELGILIYKHLDHHLRQFGV